MHIVMITPEIAPAAKVGGLADVVTGLSKDLIAKGHRVEVMLPMYHCMRYDRISDLQEIYEELWVPHFDTWSAERVYAGTVEGVPCRFFPCGDRFHRDSIYGFDDDMMRFAHFNRSVMEFMLKTDCAPDIIHCHDWQTGLVPVLLYEMYQQYGLERSRALYTIHNIEHQGRCWFGGDLLGSIGLNAGTLSTPDRLLDNEKPGHINMMKGGIVYSNFVTTVSPNYCNEIRTPEGGKGLASTLNAHNGKLGGVLNGLDFHFWNPETDPHLAMNYNADEFERKYANKHALRGAMGLIDEYRPIVACVTRLVPQKGIRLIQHAIYRTLERGGQFVLLGDSPDPDINGEFWRISHELGENPNACLHIGYNEELSHLIYGGADMLVVPSLFEPCGLTQLIALRYGTVPIVRRTGGLADTVFDIDHSGRGFAASNGFDFVDPNPDGVNSALDRALHTWFSAGKDFMDLARNGMRYDYSWERSGNDYCNIYNHIQCCDG